MSDLKPSNTNTAEGTHTVTMAAVPENFAAAQEQVRSFTVEGSYMIFPFTHGESGFALEVIPQEAFPTVPVVIGAGAAVVLLLAGILIKKRKAKKGSVRET